MDDIEDMFEDGSIEDIDMDDVESLKSKIKEAAKNGDIDLDDVDPNALKNKIKGALEGDEND